MNTLGRISLAAVLTTVSLLLAGCASTAPKGLYKSIVNYPKDGCRMYPAATTGNPPGQILAVEKFRNGELISPIKDISLRLATKTNAVALVDMGSERTKSAELGALVNLLAQGVPLKLNASFNHKKQVAVRIALRDAVEEQIQVDDAVKAINSLDQELFRPNRLISKGAKYYLILEAYKAKHVEISLGDERSNQSDLEAIYQELLKAKAAVHWGGADKKTLIRDFDNYYRVFYFPKEIDLSTASILGHPRLELKDVTPDALISTRFRTPSR